MNPVVPGRPAAAPGALNAPGAPNALTRLIGPLPHMRALAAPLLIVMILAMMLVPLPAIVLDLLFTFNIAVSLVVLMVAAYTKRTLDFASFPSVLLVTTLLRLALNVASTCAVLLYGHTGTGAAGQVIESFAHFLIGGSLAVGLVVFAILTIINFVVVTKGAGRIAEVSARFALDAMPGKQMAIDADMASGSIDEKEARKRRNEVTQEAEFYGSMDGASKFVRGDAIAGIMILAINMVGGLAIGMLQHNLPIETAINNYVLLAIGDGLVAQVPALVISVAAGLVVSRVGDDDIGNQIAGQLFSIPRALGLTGKKKNALQDYLAKITEWRNAFAHGKVQHNSQSGCFISYYSGNQKTLRLTDDYWDNVERVFRGCDGLIDEVTRKVQELKSDAAPTA
jgi:flagellar biosynthesis protein FlhA